MILEHGIGNSGALDFASVLVENLHVNPGTGFGAEREREDVMTSRGKDDQLKRGLLESKAGDSIRILVDYLEEETNTIGNMKNSGEMNED